MRTLTLVIKIDGPNEAGWIWDSCAENKKINGIRVDVIAEGDIVKEALENSEKD